MYLLKMIERNLRRNSRRSVLTALTVALATFKSELSPLAESFRTALASVWFTGHNEQQQPRILVLTSPNPAEGKTTVVSNLGISIAHTNRRVLLVA